MRKSKEIQWLSKHHRYLRIPILFLSLLSLIMSLTAIFFAFFSKETIDAAVNQNEHLFFWSALIISSILALQLISSAINQYARVYYLGYTNKKLKNELFSQLLKSKIKNTSELHSGDMMNLLNSDVETVSDGLIDVIPKIVFYVVRFLGAFILLFLLDQLFALLFVGFGLILLLGSRLISHEIKKRHHQLQNAESKLRSMMQESLENINVIKSFEAEENMRQKLDFLQNIHFKALRHKNMMHILTSSGMSVFFAFGYAFAIIFGAFRLKEGLITFGSLTAMIQLVSHIQSPFTGMSFIIPKYYAMIASTERLMSIDQFESDAIHSDITPADFKSLVLDHVSFGYGDKIVIHDLSLSIKKGEFIKINGESGKGKTTLFKLLLGLIDPDDGRIYMETSSSSIPVNASSRSFFSYAPQGNLMLSGTIRDNLNFYDTSTDEKLIDACKVACIYDEIKALPNGLDTKLGEKGFGLSEGQIQRLAIARALLKNAPILLLDEISSALDSETEQKVFMSIKELTDKTCLIISHRILPEDIIDSNVSL
jgi:ATP-binding cassette, subfamily B, bacterial